MANFQHLLESPFRWLAHWDHKVLTYLNGPAKMKHSRRERTLRRTYLNG